MNDLYDRISQIGIVPVVKILEAEDALPLAKALYNGGIDVAEVTFQSMPSNKFILNYRICYWEPELF